MSRSFFMIWVCLMGLLGLISACDSISATMGGIIDSQGDPDLVADTDETTPNPDSDLEPEDTDRTDGEEIADEVPEEELDETDFAEIEAADVEEAEPGSCQLFLGEYCPELTASSCTNLISVSIMVNSDTTSENPYVFVLQTSSGPWPFEVADCESKSLPLGDCTLEWKPADRSFTANCTGTSACHSEYFESECSTVDGDADEVDPDPEEEWDFDCEQCNYFVGNYCESDGDCMLFSSVRVEPRDGSCGFTAIINRAIGGPLELELDGCRNWQDTVDVGAGQQCTVEYVALSGEWTITCTGQLSCESTYNQDACHAVDGDQDGLVCEGCETFSGTYCEGPGANTCGVPEFSVVPGAGECQWDIEAEIMGYPLSYTVDGCGDWSMEQFGCALEYTAATQHFSVNCSGYINCQSDFSKSYCSPVDGDEEDPVPDVDEEPADDPVTCAGCEDFPGTYCEDGGSQSCGLPYFDVYEGSEECAFIIAGEMMGYPMSYDVTGCGEMSESMYGCTITFDPTTEEFEVTCSGMMNCHSTFSKDNCGDIDGDDDSVGPDEDLEESSVICRGCDDMLSYYCPESSSSPCDFVDYIEFTTGDDDSDCSYTTWLSAFGQDLNFSMDGCGNQSFDIGMFGCTLTWLHDSREYLGECDSSYFSCEQYFSAGTECAPEEPDGDLEDDTEIVSCEGCEDYPGEYCMATGNCQNVYTISVTELLSSDACTFNVTLDRTVGQPEEFEANGCADWTRWVDVGGGQQCLLSYEAVSGEFAVDCEGISGCYSVYDQDSCQVDGDQEGVVCEGCETFAARYCEHAEVSDCGVEYFDVVPDGECRWQIEGNVQGFPVSYPVEGCGDWETEQYGCVFRYEATTETFFVDCDSMYMTCEAEFGVRYCETPDGDIVDTVEEDQAEQDTNDSSVCEGCETFAGRYCERTEISDCDVPYFDVVPSGECSWTIEGEVQGSPLSYPVNGCGDWEISEYGCTFTYVAASETFFVDCNSIFMNCSAEYAVDYCETPDGDLVESDDDGEDPPTCEGCEDFAGTYCQEENPDPCNMNEVEVTQTGTCAWTVEGSLMGFPVSYGVDACGDWQREQMGCTFTYTAATGRFGFSCDSFIMTCESTFTKDSCAVPDGDVESAETDVAYCPQCDGFAGQYCQANPEGTCDRFPVLDVEHDGDPGCGFDFTIRGRNEVPGHVDGCGDSSLNVMNCTVSYTEQTGAFSYVCGDYRACTYTQEDCAP